MGSSDGTHRTLTAELAEMGLAIILTAFSAGAFAGAFAIGWRISSKGGDHRETAAALLFGVAILLLVVAIIMWCRYIIFMDGNEAAYETI